MGRTNGCQTQKRFAKDENGMVRGGSVGSKIQLLFGNNPVEKDLVIG